jgi:hypothetical protein
LRRAFKNAEIKGLKIYIIPNKKFPADKNRIQVKNEDHLVTSILYDAGILAGHSSQVCNSLWQQAAVATDILTEWNNGRHTKVRDKLK